MAESDRRPGESDRDWTRRLADMAARKKRKERDEARQASLDSQAEMAEIREALGDEVWLADITNDLFGMTPDEVDAAMTAGTKSRDWTAQDQAVMDAYDQAKKKRLLEGKKGRNKRVARHLRKNKGKIERATKKGKSGCAWAFALLAVAGGGTLYGLFEAGRTLVSALGH